MKDKVHKVLTLELDHFILIFSIYMYVINFLVKTTWYLVLVKPVINTIFHLLDMYLMIITVSLVNAESKVFLKMTVL